MTVLKRPRAAGLYDPQLEHDACGIGAVARLDAVPTHDTVAKALQVLDRLEHRGAAGAELDTGDGAGILLQIPDEFFRAEVAFDLPPAGQYAVGMLFLPKERTLRGQIVERIRETIVGEGQELLGWRDVPVDSSVPGATAAAAEPFITQVFIGSSFGEDQEAFERKVYVIRRLTERGFDEEDLAIPSFSSRTIVYKGMLTSPQLPVYFPDLRDERVKTAVALVHSRFSTNTFPSWQLAHPYRLIAHNGEINTVQGNTNWMRARESELESELFGDDMVKIAPVIRPGGSDSAVFDNVLELLVLGGRSLPHALMMMIPEAWQNRDDLPDELVDFYAYHDCVMEPWDGPAAVVFCDGRVLGGTLDRNGLRPGRWLETNDGFVVMASETGVLDFPAEEVKRKSRFKPGNIFMIDLEEGRIVEDAELKHRVATQKPYGQWYRSRSLQLSDLEDVAPREVPAEPLRTRQLMFGYTQEDIRVTLAQMGGPGAAEPIGSMGNDFTLAVLSDREPLLYSYFKQLFAQVTNPAIDPIREELVMSLSVPIGPEENLFAETAEHAHQLLIPQPILTDGELEKLRQINHHIFRANTLDTTFPSGDGPGGMDSALDRLCREASAMIEVGDNILILSDRAAGPDRAPIPALLALSAVHHHLVREGTRLRCGLVVESAEPREVHHFCTLLGFGAAAINPYLAFESLHEMFDHGLLPGVESASDADRHFVKAAGKGILKTMSKMGISTVRSYSGAQIFEAVGLEKHFIDRYMTGTTSTDRRRRPRRVWPSRRWPAIAGPTRAIRSRSRPRSSRSAAFTPGAATASITSGTPTRSASSSTPCATAAPRPSRSSRPSPTTSPSGAPRCVGSSSSASRTSPFRSRRSSPPRRSSSASPPAPCRSGRCRPSPTRRWPSP